MECSICGISDKYRRVFEAISPTGVITVCEKCAYDSGFPEVKRLEKTHSKEGKRETVYETMMRLSGVKPKEIRNTEFGRQKSVRQTTNKDFEEEIKRQNFVLRKRTDLVDNFHWIIMRVRRVKGLTQGQLAERIGESESSIKMAEQGVVPEGYVLLDKLERFLRVKLIKEKGTYIPEPEPRRENIPDIKPEEKAPEKVQNPPVPKRALNFDKKILDSLTIADLKRIKDERESEKRKALEDMENQR